MSSSEQSGFSGQGYGVLCPGCGQIYHETTQHYRGDRATTGKMLRLRKFWGPSGENWATFSEDESARDADLVCPGCGSEYTPGAKVRVLPLGSLFEEQEDAEIKALQEADKFNELVDQVTR